MRPTHPEMAPAKLHAMDIAKPDPLVLQLVELRDFYEALLPSRSVTVAIYDDAHRLISSTGPLMVPAHLAAKDRPANDRPVSRTENEIIFCVARMSIDPSPGPTAFAISASQAAGQEITSRLCEMGANFVQRTVVLLGQARISEQLFREQQAIIDNMSDGLLVLDRFGVLRYLNAPGARMLGVDARESIGRSLREVIDFEPFVTPIFSTKVGYVDRELQIRSSKVNLHIVDTAVPIVDESGVVVSIVNTFHEIARAKHLSNRMAGDRARYRFADVVGHSPQLMEAVTFARRAAKSDSNVLLLGESGTGKEVFAQSIHNESRRANSTFVAVNCAALPRDLIESELFGYSPGSFTGADKAGRLGRFELASGGTIFLDEISEMPLDVQAKLLRVLQERQVTRIGGASSIPLDVRVIAAANQDLTEMVSKKAFREDLFYRLNVLRIDLPSLRQRRDDIELLVAQSLQRTCTLLHRSLIDLSPRVFEELKRYDWPGNVRQLQNVIERLVNLTDGDYVEEMPSGWLADGHEPGAKSIGQSAPPIQTLAEIEHGAIMRTMEACNNNVSRAAAALGITRPTLYKKLRGIPG